MYNWWNCNNRFYIIVRQTYLNLKIKIPNELITIKIFYIKINLFLEIIINRNIPYPPNFNIIEAKVIDT